MGLLIETTAMTVNKAVGLTKKILREKIVCKLKAQKEEDRNRKSQTITQRLLRTQVFKKAKKVMFYIAFCGEVETKRMIEEALKLGKIVAVPVCCDEPSAMRPCILEHSSHLKKGPYGVYEPVGTSFVPISDLDLIIVPGLAFDKSGNRLGRGKGCYDRFLRHVPDKTPTIGLAYDFQIFPLVPTTALDVSVQKVISA